MTQSDRQTPHLGWWFTILFGMSLTGLLALHDGAFAWWAKHVTTLLSQQVIWWIFVVAVGIHVAEAALAWWLCRHPGLREHRIFWTFQTLLLGYPSTKLLWQLSQKQ